MRAMRTLAAAAALLAGCKTMGGDEGTNQAATEDQRFACDAARVQAMVGQTASQALGAEAVRSSGARTMRWIRPGDMVTQDYRTDRLNVHLDEQNNVVRITCG